MATDSGRDSTSDANPFRELSKTFEQFKMPGLDMSAFVESRRKDVEALVAANKITYEALQALAKTQAEMLTQTIHGMQEHAKHALAGAPNGSDVSKSAEAAQEAWHRMVADMKHVTEIVHKAQVEAMTSLAERAKDSIHEISSVVRPK